MTGYCRTPTQGRQGRETYFLKFLITVCKKYWMRTNNVETVSVFLYCFLMSLSLHSHCRPQVAHYWLGYFLCLWTAQITRNLFFNCIHIWSWIKILIWSLTMGPQSEQNSYNFYFFIFHLFIPVKEQAWIRHNIKINHKNLLFANSCW